MSDSPIEIIPSILTNDPGTLRDYLERAEDVVGRVHIDIIDGVYADNKTIDPSLLNEIDTAFIIDFHLMVDEPIKWLEKCARAGADRVMAQIEMMSSQMEFLKKTTELNLSPGLSIDMDSEVGEVSEELLSSLDVILVMSVPAGFGGQRFNEEALEKIHLLHEMRKENDYTYNICDDGGVTLNYIDDVRKEGANEVVIGNRLFNGDLATNIAEFAQRA